MDEGNLSSILFHVEDERVVLTMLTMVFPLMFQFFVVQVVKEVLIYAFLSRILKVAQETLPVKIVLFHTNFEHSLDRILV